MLYNNRNFNSPFNLENINNSESILFKNSLLSSKFIERLNFSSYENDIFNRYAIDGKLDTIYESCISFSQKDSSFEENYNIDNIINKSVQYLENSKELDFVNNSNIFPEKKLMIFKNFVLNCLEAILNNSTTNYKFENLKIINHKFVKKFFLILN